MFTLPRYQVILKWKQDKTNKQTKTQPNKQTNRQKKKKEMPKNVLSSFSIFHVKFFFDAAWLVQKNKMRVDYAEPSIK